jgi:acyl-CoA synthetase (AMP-forming)/AMP-acid ligase II
MNYRLKPPEIAYQINNSDTVVIFAGPEQVAAVEAARNDTPGLRYAVAWGPGPLPDGWLRFDDLVADGSPTPLDTPEDAAPGTMLYTAGTTGRPKGALRRGAVRGAIAGPERGSAFDLEPGAAHLVAGPMYHSAPLAFAGVNLLLGGPNVVMRRFDPSDALRLIESYKIRWTFMAPTLLMRIVNLPEETRQRYDVSSMTTIICAAAPCPFELKRRVMELFGPVLYEFYGASETGMNTLIRPDEHARKPGSCGKVVGGQEIKILDDDGTECATGVPGEIWVKAPGMIDEYYKDPEKTAESRRGEFFSVGDVGYFDDEGYLYVCDRKRDMIISGGANIYCAEIENVIHAHPKVWDVAVIGIPNDEWGEQVHAIVQPKPDETLRSQDIIQWVGSHLADYKKPRSVEFRADFPRDEAGKIRKRDLREPFWAGRETRV